MSDDCSICLEKRGGLKAIRLENRFVTSVILPQIGGKMIILKNRLTNTQFLLPPQNKDNPYRIPHFGAIFDDYDASGFDECFPTIEKASYRYRQKDKWMEVEFPDHGELWCQEWNYVIKYQELKLWINGVFFPYRFEKTIRLQENSLIVEYSLFNIGSDKLYYIWSAHPLLNVVPGAQIIFKEDLEKVFLNWASDESVGKFGDILPWPNLDQGNPQFNYSCIPPISVSRAVKCFTPILKEGMVALYYPDRRETILFEFNPREIPYVGLWLCYGGWPLNSRQKHYTIGIEPASGRPDSLERAIERNEHSVILAGDIKKWQLKIRLIQGGVNFHV